MTVELQYDGSTPVTLRCVLVPSFATLSVTAPDGVVFATPTVTLSTVSTTTTAGTTKTVLELVAVTGIAPGDPLQVTSDGVRYACTAASVDAAAKTVELVDGLPVVPDTGSPTQGTQVTATVAAPGVANVGPNWRLVWSYGIAAATEVVDAVGAAVVRQRWISPVTASDVRAIVHELGASRSDQWCAGIADDVDGTIRAKVEATGRRPWAFLSAAAFRNAGRAGVRYELSRHNIAWGGQIYEAQRELRFAFDDELSGVVGSLAYDANDDGKIDESESAGSFGVIQVYR